MTTSVSTLPCGTSAKIRVWNTRGWNRNLCHIYAHYSHWCKVSALLTLVQAPRHGWCWWVCMVGMNGHLLLMQQKRQLLLFDCFLNRIDMGCQSDAKTVQTILRCAERSAVLSTGEIVQWGFMHQCQNLSKSGSGHCYLMLLLLQV